MGLVLEQLETIVLAFGLCTAPGRDGRSAYGAGVLPEPGGKRLNGAPAA